MGASKVRILLFVPLLLASAAQAQLWRGPAAIEVRAEDKGKPAAGGEVRLEFLDMEPPAGPVPVKLDSRGRAVIGALAEGRWRVEVSREGAMTYRAEILVRQDGKPDVIDAVQHNVPGAVSMMEVKLSRGRGGIAGIGGIAGMAPAPRAPEPPQSVPAAAAEPLRPAPAPAAPAAPVTPKPKPMPEPERPAPAPPVVAPATPPVQERPAPAPVQAPPVARPATPVPPPSPAPAPTPASPVLRRSFQDRTCMECRPGESSLSVDVLAAPSAAGCGDGLRDNLTRLDPSAIAAMGEGCHLLKIDLPRNARFIGYRYEVQDGGQGSDCLAGKDCPAGGRWPLDPILRRDGAGTTTVATAFENRGDRERRAVLTIYFKEGGGADAPRPIMPSKPKSPGR
jgi:hypothetical protein